MLMDKPGSRVRMNCQRKGQMKLATVGRTIVAFALLSTLCCGAWAGAPGCYTYNGAGYCQYTGRVYQAYVNSNGEVILYFDTPMPESAPSSVGIAGVTVFGATLFRLSDAPDAGKAMYASLLAAQARGATVTVQMWGVVGGYMKLDRVWVNE
jgi:hypothetical protein